MYYSFIRKMDASRDQKYIKTIVAGVCRAAEENNIGICIESLPEDTTTICNEADTFPGNSIRICDNLASLSFFNVNRPINHFIRVW